MGLLVLASSPVRTKFTHWLRNVFVPLTPMSYYDFPIKLIKLVYCLVFTVYVSNLL